MTDIGHEDIAAFLSSPVARQRPDGGLKKASSANSMRTSLRRFFIYCHESGLVAENPARLVRRALTGPPLPRALTDDEQERLLAVLDGAPERDRVLLRIMLACGLRVGSAVALNVEDVDLDRGVLLLRGTKGDRVEEAVLPKAAGALLREYVRDRDTGPLFPGRGGRRLSTRHIQRLFTRYVDRADVATTSTHSLRHSFAMRVYQSTGDLRLTQRALRHRAIASTVVYTTVADDRLREVLEG